LYWTGIWWNIGHVTGYPEWIFVEYAIPSRKMDFTTIKLRPIPSK